MLISTVLCITRRRKDKELDQNQHTKFKARTQEFTCTTRGICGRYIEFKTICTQIISPELRFLFYLTRLQIRVKFSDDEMNTREEDTQNRIAKNGRRREGGNERMQTHAICDAAEERKMHPPPIGGKKPTNQITLRTHVAAQHLPPH